MYSTGLLHEILTDLNNSDQISGKFKDEKLFTFLSEAAQ